MTNIPWFDDLEKERCLKAVPNKFQIGDRVVGLHLCGKVGVVRGIRYFPMDQEIRYDLIIDTEATRRKGVKVDSTYSIGFIPEKNLRLQKQRSKKAIA